MLDKTCHTYECVPKTEYFSSSDGRERLQLETPELYLNLKAEGARIN